MPSKPVTRTPRRFVARFTGAAVTLAALLGTSQVLADARTDARQHFRAGMKLVDEKKFEEGIKELEKAYEILPHPSVAFNIARAQAEGGSLELAIRAYKTYLQSDPPDREAVQKTVAQLQEKLAAKRAAEAAPTPTPVPTGPDANQGVAATNGPAVTPQPVDQAAKKESERRETEKIVGEARKEDIYQETIVTASRGAQSPLDAPNSTTIVTRQDIHLSGITRIPELLRRVAGMDVMQITGGDENVSIRGFNSRLANKVLVLVNGRSVYNDILGATFWETLTIDVDQIERIEVVRGPGSALYGADAFAGIINIITIAPGEGKGGVRVGYGDHAQGYGSAWMSGRDGDFAYRASAGYTRYPRWTREISNDRIDVTPSAGVDQNLGADNARIDIRTSERLGGEKLVEFGGGFSRGSLDVYGIGPFNDYALAYETSDLTAGYKSKHFNARVYWSRFHGTSGDDYQYFGHTLYPSDAEQNSVDGEAEFVGSLDTGPVNHDIHVGLGYRLKQIDWTYLEANTPIENHASMYLQDTLRFGPHVSVVGSGRLDYVPYLQRLIPSPRGSILVKPTDRQVVRLTGSTAFRTPTFLESYLSLPVQLFLPGAQILSSSKREDDPNFILQPEQITSAELGYLNQQSDLFEFEITGYYNRVTDLIELAVNRNETLSTRAQGIGGYDPNTGRYSVAFGGWDNRCDVYNVGGGEAGFRVYPLEGLDVFANYALNASSQERPSGCNLPSDNRTSMHKVNAGVQVRTRFGINGEITFHYQSSQTWSEQVATPTGIVYQTFPLPDYELLNGRIGYLFYKNKAEFSATVFNALAGIAQDPPQMHPFGNRVGRRVMGFFSYSL